MLGTNALAYLTSSSVTNKKGFITLTPVEGHDDPHIGTSKQKKANLLIHLLLDPRSLRDQVLGDLCRLEAID